MVKGYEVMTHTWIFQVCQICVFSSRKIKKPSNFTYLEDPGIFRA